MNIYSIVNMLNSVSESDFHLAREIVYIHLIMKDDTEKLISLVNQLKLSSCWISGEFGLNRHATVYRVVNGVRYSYYDYEKFV